MRVLYLNPTAVLGGAERVLLSVMEAVRQAEPESALQLLLPGDGPLVERARALGVDVRTLPLPAGLAALGDSGVKESGWGSFVGRALMAVPATRQYAEDLGRAIADFAPDLVHSNGIKTHLLAWLTGLRGVPVVWHAHDFYRTRPVVGRLLRRAGRNIAGVLAVSESVGRDAAGLLPQTPVRVVLNAVDVERFSPADGDGAWLDVAAGLPPTAAPVVRVGLVATYARWKGHDVFLEAAARLLRSSTGPVRFYLIGGPIYQTTGSQFTEAELRATANRIGVSGYVGFVGFQPDPVRCYRALDIVVHASTRPEPFGLTIAEAMACGRAVIAVRAGGAAELFTDGHDALGVPPADVSALTAAVAELAGDPGRRSRLGANARRTAVERFDARRLCTEVTRAYEGFLAGPSGPLPAQAATEVQD